MDETMDDPAMSIPQSVGLDKPPTILSTRQRRDQAITATIALLAETFPKTFFVFQERRRPLKIGIHRDIQAKLDGAITLPELHQALGFYCNNPVYVSHLRKGTERLDLEGKPAGAVTADEEARAKATLAGIKRKKEARTTAKAALIRSEQKKRLSLADLKAAALARKSAAQEETGHA
jgi:ProP effector